MQNLTKFTKRRIDDAVEGSEQDVVDERDEEYEEVKRNWEDIEDEEVGKMKRMMSSERVSDTKDQSKRAR